MNEECYYPAVRARCCPLCHPSSLCVAAELWWRVDREDSSLAAQLVVVGLERQMRWDDREDLSGPQLLPHQNYKFFIEKNYSGSFRVGAAIF